MRNLDAKALAALTTQIRTWAEELGFSALGISDAGIDDAGEVLQEWISKGWHGEMDFMARHVEKRRSAPALLPQTKRVISVRMQYWPEAAADAWSVLASPKHAYVARYALGRDYHRLMRRRLQRLAERITSEVGEFRYRAFVDSAPVMEKPLGQAGGIGWIGKHTNLIDPGGGSWFFLGELYTDLPLPTDPPGRDHCGSCRRCIDACPTGALDTPYQLDARQCIAYLTIEHKTAIPEALRPAIGNRIFGCDDCQLVCPHNRDAPRGDSAFLPRFGLDRSDLASLFEWDEESFIRYTAGSAIRRLGFERWMRNIAVALGNSPPHQDTVRLLESKRGSISALVDEHINWAINRQQELLAR